MGRECLWSKGQEKERKANVWRQGLLGAGWGRGLPGAVLNLRTASSLTRSGSCWI